MNATIQELFTANVQKKLPTGGIRALMNEIDRLKSQVENQSNMIEFLEKQSTQDALTGLINRRGFEEGLDKSMADYRRYSHPGALLLIDLNDFKAINDTLGHQAGDAVLIHVAQILETYTRESDMVARIGGDEFCIILKEATEAEANLKRKELEYVIKTSAAHYGDRDIYVSASIGVSTFAESTHKDDLIEKADAHMYRNKLDFHNAG